MLKETTIRERQKSKAKASKTWPLVLDGSKTNYIQNFYEKKKVKIKLILYIGDDKTTKQL